MINESLINKGYEGKEEMGKIKFEKFIVINIGIG